MNLLHKISPLLFKVARSRISGLFIGFSFAKLSRLLPVKRLAESSQSIAFYHPVPSYDFHGLVVPKLIKPAFLTIVFAKEEDCATLIDILRLGQQVGREQQLGFFSIIVNGGIYQDVPQVHFHIAKNEDDKIADNEMTEPKQSAKISIFRPVASRWAHHLVLQHDHLTDKFVELDLDDAEIQASVADLFEAAQSILEEERPTGFSIIIHTRQGNSGRMSLEIVSNHPDPQA